MVVTDSATGGEAEPDLGSSFRAVAGVEDKVFLINGTAFVAGDIAAIKTAGDFLVECVFGQEVAGELFDGELIEGFVAIEGADDPIAVGPHFAVIIEVNAVAIGIAGG